MKWKKAHAFVNKIQSRNQNSSYASQRKFRLLQISFIWYISHFHEGGGVKVHFCILTHAEYCMIHAYASHKTPEAVIRASQEAQMWRHAIMLQIELQNFIIELSVWE